jgi:phosphoribosylformimino-5-aminoimidazole carboxamide ribotide isomerase
LGIAMHVIPVIDLSAGRAVHARGGDRARYEPVRSALAPATPGDAAALARAYREVLGAGLCYVADLDAIRGGSPQRSRVADLAGAQGFAGQLLVDAGVTDALGAVDLLACGAERVIVGLETLPDFGRLAAIVGAVGAKRVTFSLDLGHGVPLGIAGQGDAPTLARRAVEAGVSSVLLLDLGRVGAGTGVDLGLLRRLRAELESVELLAGGGVRDPADLVALADAGCDAALVGTAVHEGRITGAHVAALAQSLREIR